MVQPKSRAVDRLANWRGPVDRITPQNTGIDELIGRAAFPLATSADPRWKNLVPLTATRDGRSGDAKPDDIPDYGANLEMLRNIVDKATFGNGANIFGFTETLNPASATSYWQGPRDFPDAVQFNTQLNERRAESGRSRHPVTSGIGDVMGSVYRGLLPLPGGSPGTAAGIGIEGGGGFLDGYRSSKGKSKAEKTADGVIRGAFDVSMMPLWKGAENVVGDALGKGAGAWRDALSEVGGAAIVEPIRSLVGDLWEKRPELFAVNTTQNMKSVKSSDATGRSKTAAAGASPVRPLHSGKRAPGTLAPPLSPTQILNARTLRWPPSYD